jgi:hypothetical protein
MGYDPHDNQMNEITSTEVLKEFREKTPQFLFTVGEEVTVKGVHFKIHDIGEQRVVLKPVSAA